MKNPFREKQAEEARWTVIGYSSGNRKDHHGLPKQLWAALNMRTGVMGPTRNTYEEAEKDFKN